MADKFTESDGRQLAVDLLRELGAEWKDFDFDKVPDGEIKEATIGREPETFRRFLRVVRGQASPALERGFLCVLSDYIGSSIDGTVADPEFYEPREDSRHG